MPFKEKQITQR